jgi:hypothetical protein
MIFFQIRLCEFSQNVFFVQGRVRFDRFLRRMSGSDRWGLCASLAIAILFHLAGGKGEVFSQLNSASYHFPSSDSMNYQLPKELGDGVIQQILPGNLIFSGYVFVVGNNSIFYFEPTNTPEEGTFTRVDDTWGLQIVPGTRLVISEGTSFVTAILPLGIYSCSSLVEVCTIISSNSKTGPVTSVSNIPDGIAIGSLLGLFIYSYSDSDIRQVQEISESVNAVAFIPPRDIVAGTDTLLWRFLDGKTWHYFRVPGIIDGPISSLEVDLNGALWIGNNVCMNIQHSNLTMERIGYQQGLISTNISSLSYCSHTNSIWVGSSLLGAFRIPNTESRNKWKYFFGPRWLPSSIDLSHGNNVSHIVCLPLNNKTSPIQEAAIVATNGGLAFLFYSNLSLEEKSEKFTEMIYPRHDRYGLIADCFLSQSGNLSTWTTAPNENNGLWTSIYLASQCFRFAVTKNPQAKINAWAAFQGMEFLHHVTGVKGYMARSFAKYGDPGSSGDQWFNSTSFPGWVWLGRTNHFFQRIFFQFFFFIDR